MLLTKRLTTFLNDNTSPHLHTLLLLTPTGKLLSSSSPLPASTLRMQSTIASSLWSQYSSSQSMTSSLVSASLPDVPNAVSGNTTAGREISNILIQLEFGIMVIRGLQSGLLFVAIGPSSTPPVASQRSHHQLTSLPSHLSPPSSPLPPSDVVESNDHLLSSPLPIILSNAGGGGGAAPSEAGSLATNSSMTTSANILGLKKQAGELGEWLNKNLEGFTLSPPDLR